MGTKPVRSIEETSNTSVARIDGEADPNWPEWYAKHMVAEQAGTELPT